MGSRVFRSVFFVAIPVLLVIGTAVSLFISTPLLAFDKASSELRDTPHLNISVDQGHISLKATNTPLRTILERIGQELSVKVDAEVAEDKIVTDEFHALPLDDALKRLAPNYVLVSDKSNNKLAKIVLLPEGEAAPEVQLVVETYEQEEGPYASGLEPFKFEIDPAEYIQQEGQ